MRISKIIGKTDEPVDSSTKIGEIKAQGLAFSVSLCTKTVYNIIDRGDFHRLSGSTTILENHLTMKLPINSI
jgi:ISTde2, transposase